MTSKQNHLCGCCCEHSLNVDFFNGQQNLFRYTVKIRNKILKIRYRCLRDVHWYNALITARQTFNDESVAVAIGPQIDVFTSTDYVILHQVHFVTSAGQLVDQGYRTMPILPDPKSLSTAVAKIVKYLDWNTVAFLSQGNNSLD